MDSTFSGTSKIIMTVGYEKIFSHTYDHKCNQTTPGYKVKTVVGNDSR